MSKSGSKPPTFPPAGVKLSTDLDHRPSGVRARARWTDPATKQRITRAKVVPDDEAAEAFFDQLRRSATLGVDLTTTLADYIDQIGDRWKRSLDPTSTADIYAVGLRLRVIPALGHIPVTGITTGMIDRTIDDWETRCSASVIKNTVAPLVRVLDEAVRDEIISDNPARRRATRSLGKSPLTLAAKDTSPRRYAIKDLPTLTRLADACGQVHQCYSDFVMLCALLASRGSEVAGLNVGDVDWDTKIVTIYRQTYPGAGGLVTKQTKGREERRVPILQPLVPIPKRLTEGREPDERLLTGPRGGVLTTASVRKATKWDGLVTSLGLPDLTRHGLRHTGATWLADAGVPLHVLQRILGHKSIETTRGHLHPDHRHLASAAEQANAFLAAQVETPDQDSPNRRPAPPGIER